jgi:hypothetical protein
MALKIDRTVRYSIESLLKYRSNIELLKTGVRFDSTKIDQIE